MVVRDDWNVSDSRAVERARGMVGKSVPEGRSLADGRAVTEGRTIPEGKSLPGTVTASERGGIGLGVGVSTGGQSGGLVPLGLGSKRVRLVAPDEDMGVVAIGGEEGSASMP